METANKIWHTAADTFRDDPHPLDSRGTPGNVKQEQRRQQHGEEPIAGVPGRGTVTDPYDAGNRDGMSLLLFSSLLSFPEKKEKKANELTKPDQPGAVKGQEATVPVHEAQSSLPSSHLQPSYESKKTTLPDRSTTGSSTTGAAGAGAHSGTFTKGGVDSSSDIWVPGEPGLEQRDANLGLSGYGRDAPEPRTGAQTSKVASLDDTDVRASERQFGGGVGGIGATGATGSGSASAGRYAEPVSTPAAASTSSTSGLPSGGGVRGTGTSDSAGYVEPASTPTASSTTSTSGIPSGAGVRGTGTNDSAGRSAEPVSSPTARSTASTFSPPPRSSGGGDAFAKAGMPAKEEEEETAGSRSVSAKEEPSVLRMPSSISDERRSKHHEANSRHVDPDVLRGPSVSGINEQTKIRFEKEAEKAAKEDSGTSPANIPLASGPGTRERSTMPTGADKSETATKEEQKQTSSQGESGLQQKQQQLDESTSAGRGKSEQTEKKTSTSGLSGAGLQQQQQQDQSTSAGRAQSGHQVLDKSEQSDMRTSTMGQSGASDRQASQAVQDAEQRDSSGGGAASNGKPRVQQGASKEALQGPQGPPPKEYEFEKELTSGQGGKGGSKTADLPDSKGTGTGQKAQQAKQEPAFGLVDSQTDG
ncbi:hypothetical protein P168DRAFT_164840 [Aspergillus campestris IBT 28561]|uniref:Uncharacterized protein n=1 Tax=Aspergillus campestris (strain IBT 28561) TaxID=1392248 RepID=A0A2I1D0Z9_ASPC2|nr:uncharacterized protein P168DRAFT_164840 [Aspergillus campestris IBT 28561]PKY03556.1 hypothetical protein P168DRAFT_164840 [Aspergillus campestris IBT 28561]